MVRMSAKVDAVTRLPFADIMMRKCPHEKVQARYGADCYVSVYTCKRCQHGVKHPFADAWSCKYEDRSN